MNAKSATPKKIASLESRRAYTPYTALTLDSEYCVCTYGDAATNLFGYAELSVIGKHISKILPALSDKLEKNSAPSVSRALLNEIRMEAKRADGNTFPVMVGLRQDYLHGYCRHLVLIRNLEDRPA